MKTIVTFFAETLRWSQSGISKNRAIKLKKILIVLLFQILHVRDLKQRRERLPSDPNACNLVSLLQQQPNEAKLMEELALLPFASYLSLLYSATVSVRLRHSSQQLYSHSSGCSASRLVQRLLLWERRSTLTKQTSSQSQSKRSWSKRSTSSRPRVPTLLRSQPRPEPRSKALNYCTNLRRH